jgi:hypothetical protein
MHHYAILDLMNTTTTNTRTTVTLEKDVHDTIIQEIHKGGSKTFKDALHKIVRQWRSYSETVKKSRKPVKLKTFNMGTYDHVNYDKVSELLEEIEGHEHR